MNIRTIKCVAEFSDSNCKPGFVPRAIFFSLTRCEAELDRVLFFAPSNI
jgi:hypothetical protein